MSRARVHCKLIHGATESVIARRPPSDGNEWECQCARCGSSLDFDTCGTCGGEGLDGHDCGEDTCCCLYPDDNSRYAAVIAYLRSLRGKLFD